MKLYIKCMVSFNCIMCVKAALNKLGLHYKSVELGEVELFENTITIEQYEMLKAYILLNNLVLLEDKNSVLIERVKNLVVEMVHYNIEPPSMNFSIYISEKLQYDYNYIATLFSVFTGMTITSYILRQKIERAKELISYDELNLSEISNKLHYSSISHFSHQFKKITGITPSYFKRNQQSKKRIMLEMI